MDFVYKKAASREGFNTYGKIGVRIEVAVGRELTDEESTSIFEHCEQISSLLNITNLMNSQKLIDEIADNKAKIINLFDSPIYVREIPNGYTDSIEPWYLVTTSKGHIKIGWRKRVISIDWKDSDIKQSGYELFPEEDVTRWESGIHAWGYEKAKEYIDHLLKTK